MTRLAPFAAALLVLAVITPIAVAPAFADEPTLSPEELKSSVMKDCKTYSAFCAAKLSRMKDAMSHDKEAEATQVCERLQAEEARTLKRVIWYVGLDRARKATRETFEKLLTKCESTSPADALKARVADRFTAPAWLADPFTYKDEADAK